MIAVAGLLAAVIAGLAAFEIFMQPTGSDRLVLSILLSVFALAVGLIGAWAPRLLSRMRRLSRTMAIVAVASVLIAASAVGAAAGLMFLSSHDLRLVLVVLGFGAVLGIAFALVVTRRLIDDLRRLEGAAGRLAGGDLSVRSGLDRADEVGTVSRAFDSMAARLEDATATRSRLEAARRRLFTDIGHDLRTPLAALKAAVEALEDGVADDPERYLKAMHHELDVVSDLVDDLFLLARVGGGSFEFTIETFDLAELAEETVEALGPLARREGVRLQVHTGGYALVHGGPTQLARVIRNLVENAIERSPTDSEVRVEVGVVDEWCRVEVVDQGRGFSDEQRERAFDRFTSWNGGRDREHTGLGLAIARGLVEAHRGRIWIDAGPGGRVGFEVPIEADASSS